jgi:hypothetical protein
MSGDPRSRGITWPKPPGSRSKSVALAVGGGREEKDAFFLVQVVELELKHSLYFLSSNL